MTRVKSPGEPPSQTGAVATRPQPDVEFDPELLVRYGVTGPRYTSYPTAPNFDERFGEADYRECARASNGDPIPRPLSLYVHVPFCESPCFYCGCTRIITRDHGTATRYLEHLGQEIALQSALFDRDRPVMQLHLGGGTPNFLGPDEIRRLMEGLRAGFTIDFEGQRDFSIEIDPRFLAPGYLAALAALGFNRASFGVQDLDPAVQQAINRIQPAGQTREAVEAARDAGFGSVNLDLIYGLPRQTPDGFTRTLETVIALRPDRIALYSYAHLPERFKAQRQIEARDLPTQSSKLALLGSAITAFGAAGYRYIGMDHFALPGDSLAHARDEGTLQRSFQGYTTHGQCDLIGLGVSAISHVDDCYAQNARNLAAYYESLAAGRLPIIRGIRLDDEDMLRAELIQSIMCRGGLDFPSIERRFGISMAGRFPREFERLRQLADDGLVVLSGDAMRVTPRGRLLLRIVAMTFDAGLARAQAAAAFSRVI